MADHIPITDFDPPHGMKGLIPRDFSRFPQGCYAFAPAAVDRVFNLPLLTDQEIELGIKTQEIEKSSRQHVRDRGDNGKPIKSLDQNGQGYCWGYSTTGVVMLERVVVGLPYVRLSGHMIGCLVKGYRDQGGWNAQSAEFAVANGIAPTDGPGAWAEKSMSRSNDTPAMREAAKLHAIVEMMDLDESGERLKRQVATCLLCNFGLMMDFNHWSHSVQGVRLMSWNPFRVRIWNSWTDSWGELGMGDLEGSKAMPNGCIAVRASKPSMN